MFKIILCMIVVICSTMVGYSYSMKLQKRKKVLGSFVLELKKCSAQIRYSCRSLSSIFVDNFMNVVFTDEEPFEVQWNEMLKNYQKILDDEDVNILSEFAKILGTSDVTTEITNIDMYVEMLQLRIADADNNILLKGKLYKTLGFSLGLTIAILMI